MHAALRRRNLVAADRDHAAGRLLESRDAAQRRGLAAAGRPEQHDDLARRDAEAHIVDRRAANEKLLAQMRDDQFGGHSLLPITAGTRRPCSTLRSTCRRAPRTRRTSVPTLSCPWQSLRAAAAALSVT